MENVFPFSIRRIQYEGVEEQKIRQSEPSDPSRPTVGRKISSRVSLSDEVLWNVKILRRFSEKNKDLGEFFGQPVQRKRRPAVFRPADPVRVHRRPTAVFRPKKKKVQSVRLDHRSVNFAFDWSNSTDLLVQSARNDQKKTTCVIRAKRKLYYSQGSGRLHMYYSEISQ